MEGQTTPHSELVTNFYIKTFPKNLVYTQIFHNAIFHNFLYICHISTNHKSPGFPRVQKDNPACC